MNKSKPLAKTSKAKSLGKGLSALIKQNTAYQASAETENLSSDLQIREIPLEVIRRNQNQPRREFAEEELNELAESIRAHGVLQAILLFEDGGIYRIIAGERRFRACHQAGLATVPARIIDKPDDSELMQLALIENIQREDLNPLDLAAGYRSLIEEYGMTQEELASSLGKNRASIANVLRLVKLHPVIKVSLKEGRISFGHAKVLLSISDEEERLKLWQQVTRKHLSVRQLEDLIKRFRQSKAGSNERPGIVKPFDILQAEENLRDQLGTKVSISPNRNRGSISINYHSKEELDRLLTLLGESDE
jgi:ParB family transcriptional regulator, chromosome partitioning protein